MWILLVVSFISEHNEFKVTEFSRYESEQQCFINQTVLKASFTEGEKAICVNE
jgi:hypothetical protein